MSSLIIEPEFATDCLHEALSEARAFAWRTGAKVRVRLSKDHCVVVTEEFEIASYLQYFHLGPEHREVGWERVW